MDQEAEFEQEGPRPTMLAVWISVDQGQVRVAASCAQPRRRTQHHDRKVREIVLYEFVDNDQLSNLESLVVQTGPNACYVAEGLSVQKGLDRKLSNILEALHVELKRVPKNCFASNEIENDLRTLLGEDSLSRYNRELELSLALKATACLIKEYIMPETIMDQYQDDSQESSSATGTLSLLIGNLHQYMLIDSAAVASLNLFPGKDDINAESSVHGVLDKCVTKKLGTRLLSRWLRQPLVDLEALQKRQEVVDALYQDTSARQDMRDALKSTPDLDTLVRRFETQRAGLEDMYKLFLFTETIPRLEKVLRNCSNPEIARLKERVDYLMDPERLLKYKEMVESVIDFDLVPREFRVKTCHDESGNLEEIAQKLRDVSDKVTVEREKLEEKVLKGMTYRFETEPKFLKTYGYHFRVNKKHDNDLKNKKSDDFLYLAVVNSGIKWTSKKLQSLHEEHKTLVRKYEKSQLELVRQARNVAMTFMPLFEIGADLVAELDVYCSLAHCAAYAVNEYCKPTLHEKSSVSGESIKLVAARHPCLELQEDVEFISNDYSLDRSDSFFQIITGPNMGGKSTFIRQLGVIAVMAHIGSFVPCSEASFPILDAVLARVGASDAQLRGVSTFMAEMIEASAILQTATKDSLVIIDELGRGTSTYDGFGLAWAIAEELVKSKQSFGLFATHFHELTAIAKEVRGVSNRHVTAMASDEDITFLYTVNDGPCDRSFGINIAKLAGFPESVVETAKLKADELEAFAAAATDSGHANPATESGVAADFLKKFGGVDPATMDQAAFLEAVRALAVEYKM